MRVLVIGGYGTFGGRLVDLLLDEGRLVVIVAGRSLEKARKFVSARGGSDATLEAAEFDRTDPEAGLRHLRPDVVVDATGPFQSYGPDPYRAVRATLAAGAHWLDLADAAEFVTGIRSLDTLAREAGRFVLSGASSFPVLSTAVVAELAKGMRIDTVDGGIAPSPYAGVGYNVIEAIASYAGKKIPRRVEGRAGHGYGMVDSRHFTVAVPGEIPLPRTRFALVEVPDLEVIGELHPEARDVWIGAGPTPRSLHRLLWLCAHPVKWGMLPSLSFMAPLMDRVVNTVPWGEHRGGMWIRATGADAEGAVTRSWHLLAEGDMGPHIPAMACEIIIRGLLDGTVPGPGARPASGTLSLAQYEQVFAARGIKTGFRERREVQRLGPHRAVMGTAYERLSAPLRRLHGLDGQPLHEGVAEVEGATNALGSLVARVFGFPRAGGAVHVALDIERHGDRQRWTRRFGGRAMTSVLEAGKPGSWAEHHLVERFGPLEFAAALVERDGGLSLHLRGWRAFGIPMPRFLMPRTEAREHAEGGRFRFSVEIRLPVIGRLVRYAGWLEPRPAAHESEAA